MFTHSLEILLENKANDDKPGAKSGREKARHAMHLASTLKTLLLDFVEKPDGEQQAGLQAFKDVFSTTLHDSHLKIDDAALGRHRKAWKVIVANTLLALTGIGLLAIGINLAVHQRFFWQRTRREELRDETEEVLTRSFQQ